MTDSSNPVAHREDPIELRPPAGQPKKCLYCPTEIIFMNTYIGRRLPFNADAVSKDLDDGTGWVPGRWEVKGKWATVLAPLVHYSSSKKMRIGHVLHLHNCRTTLAEAASA